MNVLVTGGAGYIGSHTCKALAEAKHLPVTYDNLCYGHEWAVKWGPLEKGELADTPRIVDVIRKYRIEAVMHFAALCYVGESVSKPDLYYRNNVLGSLSLLEAMRETGVKHLVFSSSCAIYGTPIQVPFDESHPQSPVNPYGNTKLVVEKMLQDFESAYGLSSVALRYFNAAGADPEGEIGESHEPEAHLIPLALRAVLGGEKLTIFGDDYPTPDGTCLRDYVHVTDLADAHVLTLDALREGQAAFAYNLGNGNGFSVRQVVNAVEKVTARKVPILVGARRPGDPPALIADSSKARRELGWSPRHSTLEAMVESAWRWSKGQ